MSVMAITIAILVKHEAGCHVKYWV